MLIRKAGPSEQTVQEARMDVLMLASALLDRTVMEGEDGLPGIKQELGHISNSDEGWWEQARLSPQM